MNAYALALTVVAYIAVAIAICAILATISWRDAAHYYRDRLRAREALCNDRRCRLDFDPAPIPFFPPERPDGRVQDSSRPG